jgi:hypothetical protein
MLTKKKRCRLLSGGVTESPKSRNKPLVAALCAFLEALLYETSAHGCYCHQLTREKKHPLLYHRGLTIADAFGTAWFSPQDPCNPKAEGTPRKLATATQPQFS